MAQHLVAWFENGDFGGVDTSLDAVADESVATEGDFIRVPQGIANLLGESMVLDADTVSNGRIESPSLRTLANQEVSPLQRQQALNEPPSYQWHGSMPRAVAVGESLEAVVNTDQAATPTESGDHWAGVWLGDGPVQPVQGNVFTTRATASVAQANGAWNSGQLTFAERLPIANYQVVGMRVESSDGIFARLIFIDSARRPGVIVTPDNQVEAGRDFRYGRAGVFGQFDLNQPPSLEVLGGVATSQVVYLDLIRQ